ncbi:MAG TPA: alpha-amylase family glycosyl hydrolase [Opitutaceae bacterium]
MSPRLLRCVCFSLTLTSTVLAASVGPVVPRITHPGTGQTFYFVLTDRFANGRTDNDTGGYPGGPNDHGFDPTRVSHYHGGDFAGLTARLDYLKGLGITAVWVTPPFKNKPVQSGTAGYHGYWITDFLSIDPHLGTNEEYRAFIREAHARGMRVYMDIIVNHTADVIGLQGDHAYRPKSGAPYRTSAGQPFDDRAVAFNGLNDPSAFPALSAAASFPYTPVVPEAEKTIKHPAWLNDVTLYHNRGNTTFVGENSVHGDFVGLDDLFTEHPRVVEGFVDIFSQWLELGVDGFRIDTVRHVNSEFWQAFSPAIRARARALGRPDFLQFGEVYNDAGDPAVLAEFSSNTIPIDTTLDFGFFAAARRFVSQGGTSAALADFFARDDHYTDHDSNVHATTTFLGNHDAGRFAYFLQQDNPGATDEQLLALSALGHGLLYFSRGQPVIYYGDEQGMIGRGGNDMQARESLFASRARDFATAKLLGTSRTGAEDKYDPSHPLYRLLANLGSVRAAHPALRVGAMIPRATNEPALAAFSRIERGERVEYLAVFNASRTEVITSMVPTAQPAGATLRLLFGSQGGEASELRANAEGRVPVRLAPLQFALWRADSPLPAVTTTPSIALVNPAPGASLAIGLREVDGLLFPTRREIRAEVTGGDGLAEVTFALVRAARPGQYELLGTDDTAPYRVFWTPPADLVPGEKFELVATVNNLRGGQASARVGELTVAAAGAVTFGIPGSKTPRITQAPAPNLVLAVNAPLTLSVGAEGTGPLEYQWLRNGEVIPYATAPQFRIERASPADAGEYRVQVRNLAGTTVSEATVVTVGPPRTARIERHSEFSSRFVASRQVDVWLPPGYDADAAARFPVVYLHDGQSLFDPATSFGGVPWSVDRAMERLIAAGQARPAIVVGIWNTAARTAEYFPQKAVSTQDLAKIGGLVSRPDAPVQSDRYLRFLVEELKPFIDARYRTRPEREHTIVMGSSMGGLISAYALVEYPDVFGGAGCVSTHWPAADGAVIDYLARRLPAPGRHRLYFDFGTETLDAGYEPFQRRMDEILRRAGYQEGKDWITRAFPGAEHSEKSWRDRVAIPLAFLLGS